jgi:hypothetical protein
MNVAPRPDASLLVTLGIPALALAVLVAIGFAVAAVAPPADRRRHLAIYAASAAAWVIYGHTLAASGLLARFDAGPPPPFVLLLGPILVGPLLVARSAAGARLAGAPMAWLVGLHAFRLPLELVMHQAANEGTMPPQMTFTGLNLDIVTGATAIVVAALAALGRAPRWLLLAWNALGTALLFGIITIAVASLPQFHAFGADPAHLNTWVAHAPFHMLPAVLVMAAWLGHLLLWRRLLGRVAVGATAAEPSRTLVA